MSGASASQPLEFLSSKNPLQRVAAPIRARLQRAQSNHFAREFKTAVEVFDRVAADLKLKITAPRGLAAKEPSFLADQEYSALLDYFAKTFKQAGVAGDATRLQASAAAQRLQLLRAFDDPDTVLLRVSRKVADIVRTFPKTAKDIECGRNPGDVLDPYILAATEILLHGGDFTKAIATTVGHKAIMIIEGLLGHLHEDVLGEMRGNVRAPEPRGVHQELLDLETNPFPGADIIQPPFNEDTEMRFHQVKSKTGSAKGGDGRRLGEQLKRLQDYYGGQIFYDALIGNTLRGHRSRAGVERAAPGVTVLVGKAAFRELTRSDIGPQLLLRLYQAAFSEVAAQSGYRVETMTEAIVSAFKERAAEAGDSFSETVLSAATEGLPENQDSRLQAEVPNRLRKL
jgi:hypothetical protein